MCSASAPTLGVGRGKQHSLSELLKGKLWFQELIHTGFIPCSFMYLFGNTFLGVDSSWSLPVSCLCTQIEVLLSQSLRHSSEVVPTISFPGVTPTPHSPPKKSHAQNLPFKQSFVFLNLEKWDESSECQ